MASRPAPVQVSPIIKGARWSFLLCGILIGIKKKSIYQSYESRQRPIRQKEIEEHKEQLKILSKKTEKELIMQFAPLVNIELPPDYGDA